ncbi:phosphoribosyltransferase family protein [Cellulomonas sp. KRMCY2]|uniref:phosphoribosyltransferase family protein n=1 Tax=Cellulomonas sp. KRMCY2 TaxID=1304865 RepID=UPI00045E5B25|nr:phosphoribosyltransferase family protein [Cellulomonas sp. KRMCY2]
MVVFADRVAAGRELAGLLEHLRGQDLVVLGLPRGGVPVAFEVAQALDAPLDVIVVRKLGVPFQPELAMGAIGEGGARVLETTVLRHAGISDEDLATVERRERVQLEARVARLRRGRPPVDLAGRTAVVVDDGIATGSTARVACEVARHLGATRVVVAVPVAPAETVQDLPGADEVVCVHTPAHFLAVGHHYRDFSATSDEEVIVLLDVAARRVLGAGAIGDPDDCDVDVEIPVGVVRLPGHLYLPEPATAVVVFAHGSGSSRHSPRNRLVASALQRAGLGTLLLDLLTPSEELDRANVFDIELLAGRLAAATRWLGTRPDSAACRVGWFGASTGAGAALWAAAEPDPPVAAIVSRGGRPDLAGARLAHVVAPTLLIVGSADPVVLELNREARAQLRCVNRLAVVPDATHLFEEPGTLAAAAVLASDWFTRYLLPTEQALPWGRSGPWGSSTTQEPEE